MSGVRGHSIWKVLCGAGLACSAGPAAAHATQQGFVLLLPTGFYMAGGVAAVALTVLLVSILPDRTAVELFHPLALGRKATTTAPTLTSLLSFLLLVALLVVGWIGAHDPTRNPLPLMIWTLWWGVLVVLQGLIGDLWHWVNPWVGPYRLVRRVLGPRPVARLPGWFGHWPALLDFAAFAAVLLADPAPADPDHLAWMVAVYWGFHFAGMLIFGPRWLRRCEGLSVLLGNYALLALFAKRAGRRRFGLPGWQISWRRAPHPSRAVFMVVTLAAGSFDGLHETFWWLGRLGINPLEFPGRSAIVMQSLAGLFAMALGLVALFALSVRAGLWLVGVAGRFVEVFSALAPAILPIALGYHFAHYLPSLLVNAQYALRAASDPLANGADYLHLGQFYVTTGFFATRATVRLIWLTQAAVVVIGHMLAILLAHAQAVRLFGSHRKATLSQIPVASFMVLYTLFGLWLLAAPRAG